MEQPEPLDIVYYPDPFLNKAARSITAEEIAAGVADGWNLAELAERMKATMYANEGCGLAAPQVRIGLRLFVVDITEDKSGPQVILNPVLSDLQGTIVAEEGCLSIPGVRAKVKRSNALRLTGQDVKGRAIAFDAQDMLARVCQHEVDHLNGVLFLSKIGMTAKLSARRQLMEMEEDYELAQRKKALLTAEAQRRRERQEDETRGRGDGVK